VDHDSGDNLGWRDVVERGDLLGEDAVVCAREGSVEEVVEVCLSRDRRWFSYPVLFQD
jgi:hypothetical protein